MQNEPISSERDSVASAPPPLPDAPRPEAQRPLPRLKSVWGSWRRLDDPAEPSPSAAPSATTASAIAGLLVLSASLGTCLVYSQRMRSHSHDAPHVEVVRAPVVVSAAPPAASAPAPRPSSLASARAAAPPPPQQPSAPPQPAAASAAPPSPVPSATPAAPPSTPASTIDAAALPRDKGRLVIASRQTADVYVNGVRVGVTNEGAVAQCGMRFVRLAKHDSDARSPTWIMEGRSIPIACKGETTAPMDP